MQSHGDLSRLAVSEVAEPAVVRPGDVRIRIRAAALNHLDLWTLGGLPGLRLDFPHILGADGAGVVDQVGPGVTTVSPGDNVMINPGVPCYNCPSCLEGDHPLCEDFRLLGEHLPGTLAEFVVVPEHNVARIPTPPPPQSTISWTEAAAFSLVTITAWRMVTTRARVRPGESVLIWGIGGGVSSAALAIVKHIGARAIVTSSSEHKLDAARQAGADCVLNHATSDVVQEVREMTGGRGVDVVLENVGEATWERSLRVLSTKGRLVTCGATTGSRAVADIRKMFWRQWTVMGSTMGSHAEFRDIVRLLGQGCLRPAIDSVYPLEHAVRAFERLQSGKQLGKVVVEVAAGSA